MGWKASFLIATTGDEGYLTTFPSPVPGRARDFVGLLGDSYVSLGEKTFDDGDYTNEADRLYLGVYERAVVLGNFSVTEAVFSGKVSTEVESAMAFLPGCRVLVVSLHSVVDLFGYAWFEDGRLVRARAGTADDGVFFERGEPLPIERKLKAFDETIDGEELVMEMCRPFLGCRIDEYDAWDLKMELFEKRRKTWLSRRWS